MARKSIVYAAIGAGNLALEAARRTRQRLDVQALRGLGKDLPKRVTEVQEDARKAAERILTRGTKQYGQLAKRGETVVRSVRSSATTKRTVSQAKTAKSEAKAAATSTKKAGTAATVEAARNAASKL